MDVATPDRQTVLVYRQAFLAISETFVADHLTHLKRWRPVVACNHRVAGGMEVAGVEPVVTLPESGTGTAHARLRFLGRNAPIEQLVARARPSLIHAHFLTDATEIVAFACRARLPLIVTAHGYDATFYDRTHLRSAPGRYYLLKRRALMRAADAIVCVSHFIRDELVRRGFPAEKLHVIPLGVRFADLPAPAPFGARSGVLFAGRLAFKKGCAHLIDAWSRLPPALRTTPLTIIGDGPLRPDLEAQAARLGVLARFLGAQPRSEVLRHMGESRLFCFPSIRASTGDAEGMGVVLMEAQALRTPVIAFDNGPMREAIADGRSGLLVADLDIDDFSGKIARLLTDDDLAARLSEAGPAVVAERFDLDRSIAALEALYDDVAHRKDAR